MKKKILLTIAAVAAVAVGVVGISAFEARVINVTATIHHALDVDTSPRDFGDVFPEEVLHEPLKIGLSQSFLDEGERVDDVEYVIRQKPKCWSDADQAYGVVTEDSEGEFVCVQSDTAQDYEKLPLLCPFLSKHPDATPANDGSLDAFHGPLSGWNLQDTIDYQVPGRLAVSDDDLLDTWDIDFIVPCFEGYCAQDNFIPQDYQLDPSLKDELLGCDLWVEVTGISTVPEDDYTCVSWNCLTDLHKDFFVTGRQDDSNWDRAIWSVDPETVEASGEFAWVDNEPVNFEVSYDAATGDVDFTLGGQTLAYNYGAGYAFGYIIPFAKGGSGQAAHLTNMMLNGNPVDDIHASDNYYGEQMPLSDADQVNGFTLTGTVALDWEGSHPQENPAFHVFAMETHTNTVSQ